jgi:hypothetical protein
MSSTNRGSQREQNDLYETPSWAIELLLDNFAIKPGAMMECCAGRGAISRVLREQCPNNYLMQVEINPEHEITLAQYGDVAIHDFLTWKGEYCEYRTIITNPPFVIAREIIERCFEVAIPNHTDIIMYLRQAFFSSDERRDFWDKHPLRQYYPLTKRPSHIKAAKCSKYPKTKVYLLGPDCCDWRQNYRMDEIPPRVCPNCGSKVKVTSNDSSDYAWFVWSDNRPMVIKPI